MKLDHQFDEVLTSNLDSSNFTIEMNHVAFNAMIDGIYSDKIAAPLRELSTNARDAHVMNNNLDTPFDVTLPSRFDPTLRIRDYGCSMSHEFVMTVYKTMFASNKRDNNDVTGAWGLGKMTPLAYSTQFQLTCWKEGRQRSYVIYLGEKGVPDIALVYDEASDLPQGVEVSFAVREEDIRTFQDRAIPILQGFDPLPRVLNDGVELKPFDPIYSGTDWRVVEHPMMGVYARQGGVIYPVDVSNLPYDLIGYSSWRWSSEFTLIMDFNIGELSVTTARESLAYDGKTKDNLTKKFRKVIEEFRNLFKKEIKKQTNFLQACFAYSRLETNAKPLVASIPVTDKTTKWGQLSKSYPTAGHFGVKITQKKWEDPTLSYRIGTREYESSISLDRVTNATFIYTKPETTKAVQRVRRYLKETHDGNSPLFWIRTLSDYERLTGYELPVVDISELEPQPLPRQAHSYNTPRQRKPGMRMYYMSSQGGEVISGTFEPTEDTLFIDTFNENRNCPIILGQPRREYDLSKMLNYAARMEYIGTTQRVVFLTERLKERLTEQGIDWENQMVEKVIKDSLKAERRKVYYSTRRINYNAEQALRFLMQADRRRDSEITSILKDYERWYIKTETPDPLLQLSRVFGFPVHDLTEKRDELNLASRLKKRLPLLDALQSHHWEHYLRLEKVIN